MPQQEGAAGAGAVGQQEAAKKATAAAAMASLTIFMCFSGFSCVAKQLALQLKMILAAISGGASHHCAS